MIFSSLVLKQAIHHQLQKKYFPNRLRKERFETCQKISSCCCNMYLQNKGNKTVNNFDKINHRFSSSQQSNEL
jgi:hypothetical protein